MIDKLEVYIWCLSSFEGTNTAGNSILKKKAQDRLGQWRAYGADGKGACISVTKASINAICVGPLRINPVIYDMQLAATLVQGIVSQGYASNASAVDVAAALTYLVPLIKHAGFEEEREWRLLYAQVSGAIPSPKFHLSRDLFAPHHVLDDLLRNDPTLKADRKVLTALAKAYLLDFPEVMVGPSRHKALNRRSMEMKVDVVRSSANPKATVSVSQIPYRS